MQAASRLMKSPPDKLSALRVAPHDPTKGLYRSNEYLKTN